MQRSSEIVRTLPHVTQRNVISNYLVFLHFIEINTGLKSPIMTLSYRLLFAVFVKKTGIFAIKDYKPDQC